MSARPAIRRCDLKAAREAEVMFGRPVRAIARDNVTIYFDGPPFLKPGDDIDRDLAVLETRYGQG